MWRGGGRGGPPGRFMGPRGMRGPPPRGFFGRPPRPGFQQGPFMNPRKRPVNVENKTVDAKKQPPKKKKKKAKAENAVPVGPQKTPIMFSEGMTCPIEGCDKELIFSEESDYATHWSNCHVKAQNGYCTLCLKKDEIKPLCTGKTKHFRHHFKQMHPDINVETADPEQYVFVREQNRKPVFIDPKDLVFDMKKSRKAAEEASQAAGDADATGTADEDESEDQEEEESADTQEEASQEADGPVTAQICGNKILFCEGMCCPVETCGVPDAFHDTASWATHWQDHHVKNLHGPCSLCKKKGSTFTLSLLKISGLYAHFQKSHPTVDLDTKSPANYIHARRQSGNASFVDPAPYHYDLPEAQPNGGKN